MNPVLAGSACPQLVLDWLAWYPDGDLTPDVRGQIESHAAECVRCRREIADLAGESDVAVANDVAGEERVFARVQEKIAAHPRRLAPPRQRRVWRVRPRIAIAAGLVVAAISGTAGIVATRQLGPPAIYAPATSGVDAGAARGPALDVVFRADASFAEISSALRAIDANVESGPTPNGVVHLQLGEGADARAAAARLESGDLRVAEFAQLAP